MARTRLAGFVLILVLTISALAEAQVATGTPPFGSFQNSGFDTIDLANSNVHFGVNVRAKAGRGVPFGYVLSYDNSVWTPVTSGSTKSWQPNGTWGWQSQSNAAFGYVSGGRVTSRTKCSPQWGGGYQIVQTGFSYVDRFGAAHPLPNAQVITDCSGTTSYTGDTTNDGSGYTLTATSSGWGPVYGPNGAALSNSSTSGSSQDSNGNYISYSTSTSTFTDTLGQTVLTIGTVGTSPQSTTFKYTTASGSQATWTLHYSYKTVQTAFGCSGITEYGPSQQALVDEIDLPDGTKYSITYEQTPGVPANVTGRIASVTLPTGGQITYAYSGGNHGIFCSDGSTATLTRTTPDGSWTYARTPGTGAASTTVVTDPQSTQTTIQFQGIYETERDVRDSGNNLLDTVWTCYNGSTAPCNGTAVSLPITRRTITSLLTGMTTQPKTDITYNSLGLPSEIDDYDFGASTTTRKTVITYASLGNYIAGLPASVVVKDSGGNTVSSVSYTYDEGTPTATSGTPQHASITGSRGNPTTITYFVSGTANLTRHYSYFDTGNIQTATDVNTAQTSYTYGACGNSFPTSIQEPLSLSRSMAWDCVGGVVTSATDENNAQTSYTYNLNSDQFWRLQKITDPLTNYAALTYTTTSVEAALSFNSGNSTSDALQNLDSLGRPHVTQRRQAPGSTNFDSVETDYDSMGRPYRVTMPYSGTAGQSDPSPVYTITGFDALNRPTSVTDGGNGTVSYTYAGQDVLQTLSPAPTGENAKSKQFEYDALGRLISVCEITTASDKGTCGQASSQQGYWTKYNYDILGHLLGVTQNAQNSQMHQTRTFAYDGLGRLTSESNPENGTVTYTYDTDAACGTSNGDLVKKFDAAGIRTCYAYDALHRVTAITYSDTTPQKRYVYDSATVNSVAMANAKGRLAEAYTGASKTTDLGFSYSVRGEVTDVYESTPHSGGYYHVAAGYWANGALNTLSGIGLPTLTYAADGEGRPNTVNASSGQNPVTATSYNVNGQPTSVTLGSGDSDSFSYDPNTGRMTQYLVTVGSPAKTDKGALQWNANGTLAQLAITDQITTSSSQTCNFGYDDLKRIGSANCGTAWNQTFSFDPFGNISKSATVGISFQPTYNTPTNHYSTLPGFTPTYDNNGNLTADSFHSYTWDAEGNTTAVDSTGLTYDALNRMVEQANGSSYTQIVYGPMGQKLALMNGQNLSKAFVPLPGGPTAVYGSGGLSYYRHADWLGSSRLASTPSQAVYSETTYGPYGEPYDESGIQDRSFAGQNGDTTADLNDFLFREYHPTQGRWLRPDPAGLAAVLPANPQTWNRYAYVNNNPLNSVDPFGLTGGDPSVCYTNEETGDSSCDPYSDEGGGGGSNGDVYYGSSDKWWDLTFGAGNSSISESRYNSYMDFLTFGIKYFDLPGNDDPMARAELRWSVLNQTGYDLETNILYVDASEGNQIAGDSKKAQCIARANAQYQADLVDAARQGADTFWDDAGSFVIGGAIIGCFGGAVPSDGLGCPVGAIIGGVSGAYAGAVVGIWHGGRVSDRARAKAEQNRQQYINTYCTDPNVG